MIHYLKLLMMQYFLEKILFGKIFGKKQIEKLNGIKTGKIT